MFLLLWYLSAECEKRKKYEHDASRTFVRLSSSELVLVAQEMTIKIDQALGPVKLIIHLGDWSLIDRRESYCYDGEADKILRLER
ncbi:Tm-1-like ATP-binding domain-containing protein [Chloroflexota bacterium]